jgi:hypothetical protein
MTLLTSAQTETKIYRFPLHGWQRGVSMPIAIKMIARSVREEACPEPARIKARTVQFGLIAFVFMYLGVVLILQASPDALPDWVVAG